MKPESNLNKILQDKKNYLYRNTLEDSNNTLNHLQGYLFTPELDVIRYEQSYRFSIKNVILNRFKSGKDNTFIVTLEYRVNEDAEYGNNLIKIGDKFSIYNESLEYEKLLGRIIEIKSTNITLDVNIEVITFEVLCYLDNGNPEKMLTSAGSIFNIELNLFVDSLMLPCTDLISAHSIKNDKLFFYWNDPTELAISYIIFIRSNDNQFKEYYTVHGNSINFNGELKPLIFSAGGNQPTDEIATIKILNTGNNMALSSYNITFLTEETPPIANVNIKNGKAVISDWEIIDVIDYNDNDLTIVVRSIDTLLSAEIPLIEYQYCKIENIENDMFISTITPVDNYYELFLRSNNLITYANLNEAKNKLITKKLEIHTGINIIYNGENLQKVPKLRFEDFSKDIKFILPEEELTAGIYYWSVCSLYNYDKKDYSLWTEEVKLIKN